MRRRGTLGAMILALVGAAAAEEAAPPDFVAARDFLAGNWVYLQLFGDEQALKRPVCPEQIAPPDREGSGRIVFRPIEGHGGAGLSLRHYELTYDGEELDGDSIVDVEVLTAGEVAGHRSIALKVTYPYLESGDPVRGGYSAILSLVALDATTLFAVEDEQGYLERGKVLVKCP